VTIIFNLILTSLKLANIWRRLVIIFNFDHPRHTLQNCSPIYRTNNLGKMGSTLIARPFSMLSRWSGLKTIQPYENPALVTVSPVTFEDMALWRWGHGSEAAVSAKLVWNHKLMWIINTSWHWQVRGTGACVGSKICSVDLTYFSTGRFAWQLVTTCFNKLMHRQLALSFVYNGLFTFWRKIYFAQLFSYIYYTTTSIYYPHCRCNFISSLV
jgi:hypothetical protein